MLEGEEGGEGFGVDCGEEGDKAEAFVDEVELRAGGDNQRGGLRGDWRGEGGEGLVEMCGRREEVLVGGN